MISRGFGFELSPCQNRDLLYLDVALEALVRSAAERGSGAAGANAGALVGPLLQNLVLSTGDNEELCYCLKAWQALPSSLRRGGYPSKEDALKVDALPSCCSRPEGLSARKHGNVRDMSTSHALVAGNINGIGWIAHMLSAPDSQNAFL